ncbi:hypothetical protein [Clostridium sp.]|uniref:hypothetical protein n=1 Tax=Clostridium sp. TaxID=1506 RepID=UPI0029076681|nr:hypothetical protein [Clostridium sp.]MDU7215839.1 hypothetical protein [Clostridium sp.]MDU7238121.1 hypothetical protein [Clostridium perfringens]
MSLKKYKLGNFKRFIVITCLVTFLFLPFSRPQKAHAFAPAIPIAIAKLLPYVGASILALAGCSFIDTEASKYAGQKLIDEYGDFILFEVDPWFGSPHWVKGSDMWNDDWADWTYNYRIDDSFVEKFDSIIDSVPKDIVSAGISVVTGTYVDVTAEKPVTFKVLENDGGTATFYPTKHIEDPSYIKKHSVATLEVGKQYRLRTQSFPGGTTNAYFVDVETGLNTLANLRIYNTSSSVCFDDKIKLEVLKEIPFDSDTVAGASKDKLTTSLPVDSSMDISNVKEFPLTADDVTAENGYVSDKTATGDVITGWKWLDDILNAILDAILSIPVAIKDGIASLFIPTLSLSDTLNVLKNKLGIPTLDLPNITSKKPFEFTIDLSAIHSSYKGTVKLDQPWWPITRAVVLAFEMYCIYIFAYRKITALHGGEGD